LRVLSDLKVGESATVTAVNGEGAIRRRLFDMGVTPGADVYFRKKAPLGDPIEISIRGYELTLRKAEAAFVEVELR
jgi:Fe2+ transport system protein FeoA